MLILAPRIYIDTIHLLVIYNIWIGTAAMNLPFALDTRDQAFDARFLPFARHAKGGFAVCRHRGDGTGVIERLQFLIMRISIGSM